MIYDVVYSFYTFMEYFDINNKMIIDIIFYYILAFIAYFVLKILLFLFYKSQYAIFNLNIKDINKEADIKDGKCKILNKVVKRYIKSVKKGISYVDTKTIVKNQVIKLNFLGINYASIENFLFGFEYIFIISGILFYISFGYENIMIVVAVISFIAVKLINSIFDIKSIRERFIDEMTEYVNREIGQFFINDLAMSIQNFKSEMKDIFNVQTKSINEAILNSLETLANAVIVSNKELNNNVNNNIKIIAETANEFNKPIENWKNTLNESINVQENINQAIIKMNNIITVFETSTKNLSEGLEKHSKIYLNYSDSVKDEIKNLSSMVSELEKCNKENQKFSNLINEQISYTEKNQKLLDESIQKYELMLENITSKMGESFGSIVEYQIKDFYNKMSENINGDIIKFSNSSNNLVEQMKELFSNMSEQSKLETAAITKMKEQIEIYFENENKQ